MKTKIYNILSVRSESGDDYGPYIFDYKPTDEELLEFLREEIGGPDVEDPDGPGFMDTWLYENWTTSKVFTKK